MKIQNQICVTNNTCVRNQKKQVSSPSFSAKIQVNQFLNEIIIPNKIKSAEEAINYLNSLSSLLGKKAMKPIIQKVKEFYEQNSKQQHPIPNILTKKSADNKNSSYAPIIKAVKSRDIDDIEANMKYLPKSTDEQLKAGEEIWEAAKDSDIQMKKYIYDLFSQVKQENGETINIMPPSVYNDKDMIEVLPDEIRKNIVPDKNGYLPIYKAFQEDNLEKVFEIIDFMNAQNYPVLGLLDPISYGYSDKIVRFNMLENSRGLNFLFKKAKDASEKEISFYITKLANILSDKPNEFAKILLPADNNSEGLIDRIRNRNIKSDTAIANVIYKLASDSKLDKDIQVRLLMEYENTNRSLFTEKLNSILTKEELNQQVKTTIVPKLYSSLEKCKKGAIFNTLDLLKDLNYNTSDLILNENRNLSWSYINYSDVEKIYNNYLDKAPDKIVQFLKLKDSNGRNYSFRLFEEFRLKNYQKYFDNLEKLSKILLPNDFAEMFLSYDNDLNRPIDRIISKFADDYYGELIVAKINICKIFTKFVENFSMNPKLDKVLATKLLSRYSNLNPELTNKQKLILDTLSNEEKEQAKDELIDLKDKRLKNFMLFNYIDNIYQTWESNGYDKFNTLMCAALHNDPVAFRLLAEKGIGLDSLRPKYGYSYGFNPESIAWRESMSNLTCDNYFECPHIAYFYKEFLSDNNK